MKTKNLLILLLIFTLTISVALLTGCGCKHENVVWQTDEYNHKQVCVDCDKVLGVSEAHDWAGTFCTVCDMGSEYSQGLEYQLSSNEAYFSVLGRGQWEGTELNISPLYYGKPVERIEAGAFVQDFDITEVTIPTSITYIGEMAIDNCINMTKVTFEQGSNLATIGRLAFAYNPNITEIILPNSVTDVKEAAFFSCQALTIYCDFGREMSNNWHSNWNPDNAPIVWNCSTNDKATDGNVYVIQDGIRYVVAGGKAKVAKQIQGLTTAHVAAKVSYKGSNYNVTEIMADAFREEVLGDIWNLETITFDDTCQISKVGDRAFENCIAIKSIHLPNTVSSLGKSTFRHCWELVDVSIPRLVTAIPEACFAACYILEQITIPKEITSISALAFSDCQSLTNVIFENAKGWSVSGINYVTSAPETIKLSQTDVANAELMANKLKYEYVGYSWKCN